MGMNLQKSADKINGYMKKSAQWVIDVGNELAEVQSFGGTKQLEELYKLLPFGSSVGNKIIAIAMDEFIKQNVDIVPSAYNTLYDLLLVDKIKNKTGVDASMLWGKFGDKTMFAGDDFTFTLEDMNINPTSTYKEIETLFKAIKLCVGSKKTANQGGSGGISGVFTFGDIDNMQKNAALAKKGLLDNGAKFMSNTDKYAKDASSKGAPVKDTSSKDTSSKNAPVKDTSSKDTSSKDAPAKDAPAKDTSPSAAIVSTPPGSVADIPKETALPPTTFVNTKCLLSIEFDIDAVTDNDVQLKLLKLQNKVQELITTSLDDLVEVKTYDVPVVNAQVKVAGSEVGGMKKAA